MRAKIEKRFPIHQFLQKHIWSYQVPSTLNLWYVFGLLALLLVITQFVSGFWLVMFYVPTVTEAFSSVQVLMHQVPAGWFIRYIHTTGASFLFITLYLHLFRAFLYGSYQKPREVVWVLGVFLWLLMMVEAFMGYVLPWGQLSYWGAQVATSALDGIPLVGQALKHWLRGAQQVGQPLLQRFYAFHIIFWPFLLFIFIKLHIVAIRCVGSSEPIEPKTPSTKIPFVPNHIAKESFPLSLFIFLFFLILFFWPSVGGVFIEGINQEPANPLHTPSIIHPAWYLTPYFAILRAIPNLTMGVLLTIMAPLIFIFLPLLDKSQHRVLHLKGRLHQNMVYLFCANFLLLGFLGWFEITPFRLILARWASVYYFSFFILMPWYSRKVNTL